MERPSTLEMIRWAADRLLQCSIPEGNREFSRAVEILREYVEKYKEEQKRFE